jgi:uncharacterized protein YmfQ (DUF2313 family)
MPFPHRDVTDYLEMLQGLLPRGPAWTRTPGARLTCILHASADELTRLDAAAHLLADEINPYTAFDGLDDWDRVLGLPDGCLPVSEDMDDRRFAVLHRLTDAGRNDLAYWYQLALDIGYPDIVIEEHRPFVCAKSEVGDADQFSPEEEQASNLGRCGPEEIRYWWNVIVRGGWFALFRCGEDAPPEYLQDLTGALNCARFFRSGVSSPPDRLGEYVCAAPLECVFQREKPAHTLLTFTYEETHP